MSRWFRHYAGMMRDEKLVRVSIKSKQPVERVLWVWGAILESAAEVDDNGRYDLDAAEVAYFLRADEDDILSIFSALSDAGRVASNVVVNWGDRQFSSDKSKERQAAYRERQRNKKHNGDVGNTVETVEATSPSQHSDVTVTAQETETETETETYSSVAKATGASPSSDKKFWDDAAVYLDGKRSLIGKWCRDYGRPETARAITAAQLERAVEPVSYIERTLRKSKQMAEEFPM